jgi:predicted DNA-binding transcriptional regulator YafY
LRSGESVSRTARLLELLIRVQAKPRFTAQELAEEFGVSRRTMLRDLRALSDMDVPLRSTPGPGGGYLLPRGGRRLSPSLTVEEALGLIVSYEAFLRYAESPLRTQSLSAVTKLRAALPPDVVGELDGLRRHVAVLDPVRDYEAPLLAELFRAAVEGVHLKVVYEYASGVSERVVYPFGVFAYRGFWYCACPDRERSKKVTLRGDRFRSVERAEGNGRPPHVPVEDWTVDAGEEGDRMLDLRVHASAWAAKSSELTALFGKVEAAPDGGILEDGILASGVDYYASRLLGMGPGVKVESPPEVISSMREKALAIANLYPKQPDQEAEAGALD